MKKLILTILSLLIFVTISFSQPPPPDPQPIPIDGGLFILLLVGIFLGGREIYLHEKKKTK